MPASWINFVQLCCSDATKARACHPADPCFAPLARRLRRDIRASLPDLKERFEKSGGEAWDLPDDKLEAFVASETAELDKIDPGGRHQAGLKS